VFARLEQGIAAWGRSKCVALLDECQRDAERAAWRGLSEEILAVEGG
jgi:hypothetical protein